MTNGHRCTEVALPKSSSSAKHSRAEGTARRQRGETGEMRKKLQAVWSGRTLRAH